MKANNYDKTREDDHDSINFLLRNTLILKAPKGVIFLHFSVSLSYLVIYIVYNIVSSCQYGVLTKVSQV